MTHYFATFPKDTGFPFIVAACIWPHLVILCHYSLSHTGLLFKDTFQWMVSWNTHLHLITPIRSKCCTHQGHFSESMGRAHYANNNWVAKSIRNIFFVSKPDLDRLWESSFWHEETCRQGGNVIFPQRCLLSSGGKRAGRRKVLQRRQRNEQVFFSTSVNPVTEFK